MHEQACCGFVDDGLGPGDPTDAKLSCDHPARAYNAAGHRVADALPLFEKVYAIRTATLAPEHPDLLTSINNLAATYMVTRQAQKAVELLEKVVAVRKEKLGPNHRDTIISMSNLALAYRAVDRTKDAIPLFVDVVAYRRMKLRPGHPDTLTSMDSLAYAYRDAKDWEKAEAILRDCLQLREKVPDGVWLRFQTMCTLGSVLIAQKKYVAAEHFLIDGYKGMKTNEAMIPAASKKNLKLVAERIVPFYEAWGKPEEAAVWRQRLAAHDGAHDTEP